MRCARAIPVRTGSSPTRASGHHVKPASFGLFALFVLIALPCAQVAFAQDDAASGDAATSANATASGDAAASTDSGANWVRVDPDSPANDLATDSAEKVLEIPQTACIENGAAIPCDERLSVNKPAGTGDDNGGDGDTIAAPAGGGFAPASPQTFDDDTANAGPIGSDSDWGTADDYANQQVYGFPYGTGGYGVVSRGPILSRGPIYGNPAQVPPSAFRFPPMAMSGPITQAARPPISAAGPWMTPPSMMTFSRPAGSPMAPMAGHSFRLH